MTGLSTNALEDFVLINERVMSLIIYETLPSYLFQILDHFLYIKRAIKRCVILA